MAQFDGVWPMVQRHRPKVQCKHVYVHPLWFNVCHRVLTWCLLDPRTRNYVVACKGSAL